MPIEQIAAEFPRKLARLAKGHLPSTVDETAFLARINAGIATWWAQATTRTPCGVQHGGVITDCCTPSWHQKILCFNVDYGVTRCCPHAGQPVCGRVNGTEQCMGPAPRNSRW